MQQFVSPILLSAETHTFPSGVAPFPGAETGTGALTIPGYELPWEETLRVGEGR